VFAAEVIRVCSADCQTDQPVILVWHVPGLLQACSGTAATEEGQSRQLIARQLPAHLQPVDRVKDTGEAGVGASASSPAQLSKLQSVPVSIQNRHSMETALLEVLNGVYTAADNKQIYVLIGLDLSATFDTVDHILLIERLQAEFGVSDTPLDWLCSYLCGRTQFVKMGRHKSDNIQLDVGVTQR